MKNKKLNSDRLLIILFYILLTVIAIVCIFPIVFALIGSFTPESEVALSGFSLLPQSLSTETYKYVFQSQGTKLINAYKNSLITTICGTALSVFITVCYAYVLSVKGFRFGNKLAFFAYFTMLFNGGMLAWYLVCTKYLGLKDNYFAMFLPYAMNVFNMYLMRNFFNGLPYELVESAKIDGAGHFRILAQIVLPLSKAGIVTIVLFYALQYGMIFIYP